MHHYSRQTLDTTTPMPHYESPESLQSKHTATFRKGGGKIERENEGGTGYHCAHCLTRYLRTFFHAQADLKEIDKAVADKKAHEKEIRTLYEDGGKQNATRRAWRWSQVSSSMPQTWKRALTYFWR